MVSKYVLWALGAVGGLCVAAVAHAGLYDATVMADNPVGYWRLDEAVGATTAANFANPGQYTGSIIGGVTLGVGGAIVGDSNAAMTFNGSNGKIDVPWAAALNTPSFSFECWARREGGPTSHQSPMTSRSATGGAKGYIFYAESGTWQFWSGPGWDNLGGDPVLAGEWAHLVGTYDAATQTKSFYVNGQLANTRTVAIGQNPDRPLRIGAGVTEGAGSLWFNGSIDEVAVYDTALAADRILAHYNAANQGVPVTFSPLFRAEFDNPGGVGLGPDASRLVFAGQNNDSPTPSNPDGTLILGGSGSGGMVFVEALRGLFDFDKPLRISTECYYSDGAGTGANDFFGLVALHTKGTSSSGPERRGGLYGQFRATSTGTGQIRLGFQSDSTATGGDLWVDNLFSQNVSGIPDPNGLFNMMIEIDGLEDNDWIRFVVTQGDTFKTQIATTVGQYLSAVTARSADAGAAFLSTLSDLRDDPTMMDIGFLSTSSKLDAYNYLLAEGNLLIPEPGSLALLGLGLAGLVARRRRRIAGGRRNMARTLGIGLMALTLGILASTAHAVPIAPPVPTTAWLLDEGTGSTTYQLAGPRTGTIYQGGAGGNVSWTTNTPLSYAGNYALDFDGVVGDRVVLDGHSTTSRGTVQFWVNPRDTTSPRYITDSTNGSRILLYRNSPTQWSLYINNTSIGTLANTLLPLNQWTQIVVTWDSSLATNRVKVYSGGNPTPFATFNTAVTLRAPANVWLGSRYSNNEAFNGLLDEYAMWNTPLSPDNVEWLAQNSVRAIPTVQPPTPTAGWLFDEGTGTLATDYFYHKHATLQNGADWSTSAPLPYTDNHSVQFDGTTDGHVEIPGHTFGTEGSIHLWVRPEFDVNQAVSRYIFDSSDGARTLLFHEGTNYALYINNTRMPATLPTELLPRDEWTDLTITWDNSLASENVKVYKNGALAYYFDTLVGAATTPDLVFLGNRFSLDEPWIGSVDELSFWSHALTLEEAGWLYQNSLVAGDFERVPEPGSLALLGLGLAGLAARRRRRARDLAPLRKGDTR